MSTNRAQCQALEFEYVGYIQTPAPQILAARLYILRSTTLPHFHQPTDFGFFLPAERSTQSSLVDDENCCKYLVKGCSTGWTTPRNDLFTWLAGTIGRVTVPTAVLYPIVPAAAVGMFIIADSSKIPTR